MQHPRKDFYIIPNTNYGVSSMTCIRVFIAKW